MRTRHWLALTIAMAILAPAHPARANGEDVYIVMTTVALAGIFAVAPIGAMVKVIENEPSKTWGRASLATGVIATATGTGLLITDAFEEGDSSLFKILGGISLGLGLNGLLWGIANEVALADEDRGIEAEPRPTPTMVTIGGRF